MNEAVAALVAEQARQQELCCLYGYDLDSLAEHVRRVIQSLPRRCRIFYAMKANTAEEILRTLAPLVHGFEVASGGELAKIRAIDPHAAVLVGGPAKTDGELSAGLRASAKRFHVESIFELHRLSGIAAAEGTTAQVLLRVNLVGPFPEATVSMAGRPTQFGICESDLPDAVADAIRLPGIDLIGFHVHSLSNNMSASAHLDMIALYRDKVLFWEQQFDIRCQVINVGGGIGVNFSDPGNQFDWSGFVSGLAELVRGFPSHWREIDFECGRYLVAAFGSYATSVLDIKRNHGINYVVIRGGTHHFRLPASWQHSHPFTIVPVEQWSYECPRPEVRADVVTVVGELCTPKDVLATGARVDKVRVGDVVVFGYAGAYGWEISHHDFLSHQHPDHMFLRDGTWSC